MCQDDKVKMYLNYCWNPNLSITGAECLPPRATAGNVVRSQTGIRLSMRLPPTADPASCLATLKKMITTDVPYGAKAEVVQEISGPGWCMKDLEPWF